MARKKVGEVSKELLEKEGDKISVIEQQEGMNEDYMKNLVECTKGGMKEYGTDFYVVVLTKAERLMPNVFRNYFVHRQSCPTPTNDQSVFKYDRSKEELAFLWSLPSTEACEHLVANKSQVCNEEEDLLRFIFMFLDGSLLTYSKELNGEKQDSPILVN